MKKASVVIPVAHKILLYKNCFANGYSYPMIFVPPHREFQPAMTFNSRPRHLFCSLIFESVGKMINLCGRISWEINQFSNNPTSIWRKNSWEATIIAVEKPVMLWWYLKKPIEHLLNRLYCTFSCNITFKPFAFDVLFTTYNCSSRLVNDSKYLSCRALIRAAGVHQFRFDCTRPNFDCDCVFHRKHNHGRCFKVHIVRFS